jgi:uncharacterized protein (DUF433 family)
VVVKAIDKHIEVTPGVAGGKPRIAGRRIKVQDIAVWHERLGRSVDEISSEYDLSLADIHAALAYYFDHRSEIDRDIAVGESLIQELKSRTPSKLARKRTQAKRRDSGG